MKTSCLAAIRAFRCGSFWQGMWLQAGRWNRTILPEVREFGTCATWTPAASLRYLKRKLVDQTQYIRHLRLGEACGLPELCEVQTI